MNICKKRMQKHPDYFRFLKDYAKNKNRVVFRDPMKMIEITKRLNEFDIDFYTLESNSFNNVNGLLNKFFEFIQARLILAIELYQEMSRITKEYDLDVVAEDFNQKSLAEKLNSRDVDKIWYYKNQCHKYAETFSTDMVKNLVGASN